MAYEVVASGEVSRAHELSYGIRITFYSRFKPTHKMFECGGWGFWVAEPAPPLLSIGGHGQGYPLLCGAFS